MSKYLSCTIHPGITVKTKEISHLYFTVEHLTVIAVVRKTMYQYNIYSTLHGITCYHWMLSLIVIIYNCCQISQYLSSVGVY